VIQATGGAPGIRDLGALESAVAQPKATFGGVDLYVTLVEKAAALCFALVHGHPSSTATSASAMPPWRRFSF
jgi:death-on-curing protein